MRKKQKEEKQVNQIEFEETFFTGFKFAFGFWLGTGALVLSGYIIIAVIALLFI